jgi:hypothetical protein
MMEERYFVHFKGGLYKMLGVASDSETLEQVVVYQALYGAGDIWVRPTNMFLEDIEKDGKIIKRFKFVK